MTSAVSRPAHNDSALVTRDEVIDSPPPAPSGAFQLLNLVLRHRRMIVAAGVVVGVVVGVLSFLHPHTYTATSSFVPQSANTQPTSAAGLAATFGISIGGTAGQTDSPQFYADMLSEDEILRRVVSSNYQNPKSPAQSAPLADILRVKEANPELRIFKLEKAMRAMMDVAVNVRTGVVTVKMTSAFPTLSKQLSDSLLASLNAFNLAGRQARAASDREFAGGRLEAYQSDLAASEQQYEDFLASNRITMSPALQLQRDRLQRKIGMLQQVVTSLTSTYEQAKIDEVRSTPAIRVLQPPRVPVEPNGRGTVKKVLLGGIVASLIALVLAVMMERLRNAREAGDPALVEFLSFFRRRSRETV